MRNPYEVLGVNRTAGDAEIKSAYRALAKQLHPDVDPGNPRIAEQFQEVTAAYEQVKDANRRLSFEANDMASRRKRSTTSARRTRPTAEAAPSTPQPVPQNGGANGHANGNTSKSGLFADFFGSFKNTINTAEKAEEAKKKAEEDALPRDQTFRLKIGFVEAATGTTRRLRLAADRRVDVRIPAGLTDGQQIRLKGAGRPGLNGEPAGDALIAVEVEPHPFFTRKGEDIIMDLPISLTEAVLGGRVKVPTIHGPVQIAIPPGSNTGTALRLKGRGIRADETSAPGDQFVTLKIVLPEDPPKDFVRTIKRWSEKWDAPVRKGMGYE